MCQGLFFDKVAGPGTGVSCEFYDISKNTFSYRAAPVAASVVAVPRPGYFAESKFTFTGSRSFNPLTTNAPCDIETSQWICIANQLTGFCMMGNIVR